MEELAESDPARIGPYELVGLLGSGGMGRVFLGRTEDGDQAAVKVVHADLARDPEFRRRFRLEADSTRDLTGTGVARVLAADPEAEPPWLATEFVDGPSLHEWVGSRGVLEPAALRSLGAALAAAVAEIHAAGLVHRDVKPPNVLLAADGPKLISVFLPRA